ncbi:sugar kinase [Neorhizobium sp. P12A]|uniref:sugar kinase n=1 Tax=Neorhizobium sp. P12A TaxID=2268027 RepID=UPI0011EE24B9|nr:sugar kinase [Neorhizobium sp. P12A]KAA0697178.1 sugar kinase [Neorhizobium sp. P12A]
MNSGAGFDLKVPPRHVLCVGAAVLDTLFRVRSMPSGQGKVLPYDMLQVAEGMASSAAYAVARLGGRASLWGAVGDDETGARIIAELSRDGIDTTGVVKVEGARSAVSTILIDDLGERLIVPFYDPLLHQTTRAIGAEDVAAFDAVLVDVRWPKLALATLVAAREAGKPAILDGDVAADGVIEMLAPAATHIVFSQPAAERLAGTIDLIATVSRLKQKFERAFVCVTAGEQGCYWLDEIDRSVKSMPAIKIEAVDTLAAGDIFHGTFALAIAEGQPAENAIRLSSVAAALKCQSFGGRMGAPTAAEVQGALRLNAEVLVSRTAG